MMDYFTKNKMLFWSVIILVLLNVATLSSFWIKKTLPAHPGRSGLNKNFDGEKIMKDRLELSENQALQFAEIRNEHFMRTGPLQGEMHKIRMDLLNELFSPEPNEATIEFLLAELGDKQCEFEENLFNHFKELKEACTDQQVDELKIMLRDLIESTRPRSHGHRPPNQPDGFERGPRPPMPQR